MNYSEFLRKTVTMSSGLALLLGALLAGCGGSGGSANGAGSDAAAAETVDPGDATPGGDSVPPRGDTTGTAGDSATQQDIHRPPQAECVRDDECGEGRYCDCWYECQPVPADMCLEDANCGFGNYCEPCERICRPQRDLCSPCVPETRCDLSTGLCARVGRQCQAANSNVFSHCLDFADGASYCGKACQGTCPRGFDCLSLPNMPDKQCVPVTQSCGSGSECETDADCPWGEVCDDIGLAGALICHPGCREDAACPVGTVCSAFRCQDACHDTDNPCPTGQECIDGHCKIPGSCVDKYDCEEPETYCEPATNMCLPGCLEDFDCKRSGYLCELGTCVKQACERNWYCAFGEVCDKDEGECVEAQGPHCDTCDPQQENACGEGNECINLQDEDGNDLGSFCFVQCEPTELDRCPQGYQCAPLQDQDGNVQNEVCFRDCSKPPVGIQ